jgi:hypothetical protein
MSLEEAFPNLALTPYATTSPATPAYNCIAWAAGDTSAWWWPDPMGVAYWPADVPRETTLESFISAFRKLQFEVCSDGAPEPGIEKVAIYCQPPGKPAHMARQLRNGRWTSKCGKGIDIEHELKGLVSNTYGNMECFMKRNISPA